MPTKGIQFYVYISNPTINVTISIGSEFNQTFNFIPNTNSSPIASFLSQQGSFEIGSSTYGIMSETFNCIVNQNTNSSSNKIFEISQSMSPLTGGVGNGTNDDLYNMMNTPSQLVKGSGANFYVSYGFYQAGIGGQHQFYIYVTDVYTTWMSDLTSKYSKATYAPFSNFFLPGAHDAGMCNDSVVSNLSSSSQVFQSICNYYGLPTNDAIFTPNLIIQSIINFAFTQKDTITNMLNLGIRFFDFRPGFCCGTNFGSSTINDVYHQHYCIPGYSFISFLTDIITWLNTPANKGEIVVVYLNFNGFASDAMRPISVLENFFNPSTTQGGLASLLAGSTLQVSGANSLGNSYQSLVNSNTRLIFVNAFGDAFGSNTNWLYNTTYSDSYSDEAYQDSQVEPIINQLTNTIQLAKGQSSVSLNVLLQLQGTITGTISGIVDAISTGACTSPLMSTKPGYDFATYSFLEQQSQNGLFGSSSNSNFYACINDFTDNALVSNCINITAKSLNVYN